VKLPARLQDPRIVPVLAAGTAGDLPFYSMPFVDGETLRAQIGRAASSSEPIPLASPRPSCATSPSRSSTPRAELEKLEEQSAGRGRSLVEHI